MPQGPLACRQKLLIRITDWVRAVCLFFLPLKGLQIFNAFPTLHVGKEPGFAHDNAILEIGAVESAGKLRGVTRVLGIELETTGFLGLSGGKMRAFPPALTIPFKISLATGRSIHFFFASVLVITLTLWLAGLAINGSLRQIQPAPADLSALPRDIADHARLRFHHKESYGPLRKLSYALVRFLALPLMILTGLAISPGFNAAAPFLLNLFGKRQTARTLHFPTMVALVGFFVVHLAMILLAGPLNEMRSILTGWYCLDGEGDA